jgi:hypothetical protein
MENLFVEKYRRSRGAVAEKTRVGGHDDDGGGGGGGGTSMWASTMCTILKVLASAGAFERSQRHRADEGHKEELKKSEYSRSVTFRRSENLIRRCCAAVNGATTVTSFTPTKPTEKPWQTSTLSLNSSSISTIKHSTLTALVSVRSTYVAISFSFLGVSCVGSDTDLLMADLPPYRPVHSSATHRCSHSRARLSKV